jgi:beta-galactosidase
VGLLLLMGGSKPVILVQPQDATKAVGETATFSVTARDAKSYQWLSSSDGVSFEQLPEATSTSYTTGTLSESDNGLRLVVWVTNGYGTAVSRTALLTVTGQGGLPE